MGNIARLSFLFGFLFVAAPNVAAETIRVAAGGDLQSALNAAKPGDVVALAPQAVFLGQFTLPPKDGQVVLTTDTALPDRRISPSDTALAAIISPYAEYALGIHDSRNWKIDGIRFVNNTMGAGEVISIWRSANIYLDRILLVVPADQTQKRGVLGNGTNITLTRSYIAGVNRPGQDSQAFCAWDGAGPYVITDNFLEAAGENVMFGGDASSSVANIPADILVDGNTMSKPLWWKQEKIELGISRTVKNLFELKSAKRVIVRNNIFENNWTDGQSGYAIVITTRNDADTAPWSVVEDVLFERNIVRNTERGVNILGYDSYNATAQTKRINIRDNTIDSQYRLLQIGAEAGPIEFINNIIPNDNETLFYEGDVRTQDGTLRPALYAVEKFTHYGNSKALRLAFDGSIESRANAETMIKTLVTAPVTTEPPPPPPPPSEPTDLTIIKGQLEALQKELATVKGQFVLTQQRLDAALLYLSQHPTVTKALQIVQYLRLVPR